MSRDPVELELQGLLLLESLPDRTGNAPYHPPRDAAEEPLAPEDRREKNEDGPEPNAGRRGHIIQNHEPVRFGFTQPEADPHPDRKGQDGRPDKVHRQSSGYDRGSVPPLLLGPLPELDPGDDEQDQPEQGDKAAPLLEKPDHVDSPSQIGYVPRPES